ncbi:MAG: UDP-3-O-(3-hydroxymyristoyl)glucosamine N-acyltransferase [Phycisphaerales bacterium]|nr:MAG: UDP-3-O-(3-hydroxymyristoyl)glucosamine N-acyltransferase [Phycisphaerales bacterium]
MPAPTPDSCRTRTPLTIERIVGALRSAGLRVEVDGALDMVVERFDAAHEAGAGGITFVRSPKFLQAWLEATSDVAAAAAIVPSDLGASVPRDNRRGVVLVDDVDHAASIVLGLLMPASPPRRVGVHPSASVDPLATIDEDVSIGPFCVVEAGARLARGVTLRAHAFVGMDASIGEQTTLHVGAKVMERCEVGERCILHEGCVVGSQGFGFRPTKKGAERLPHIGNVVLGHDVEIGANSCVDRAKFGSTTIGDGTKIDNLTQIAHNCRIGRHCIVCGNVGIAGSAVLGDGCVIGGLSGIADNIEIGAGAKIGAHSGVAGDLEAGGTYMGIPAGPIKEWRRNYIELGRLAESLAEIRKLVRGKSRDGKSDGGPA